MTRTIATIQLFTALALAACTTAAPDVRSTPSVTSRSCETNNQSYVAQGRQLYHGKAVCYGCHGINGDPSRVTNPDVAKLNPQPTDLRRTASLKYPSNAQRFDVIANGIRGTGMISFHEHLTAAEIGLLIEYLDTLQQGHY